MNRLSKIEGSPKGQLGASDGKKIGLDSTWAAGSAIVTFLLGRWFPDMPEETRAVIFVAIFAVIKAGYKLFSDTRFRKLTIAFFLIGASLASAAAASEIKTVGDLKRDHFCRIISDKSGKWIVLGPNSIIAVDGIKIANIVVGEARLQNCETIIQDDGKSCIFVGSPGVYAVIQFVPEEMEPTFLAVRIMVAPGPMPGPNPGPNPSVPDGDFGMTRIAYDEAIKINRPAIFMKLASNFEAVASKIAAGGVDSVREALSDLTDRNKEATTTEERQAALPFFEVWQKAANSANENGSLRTIEQYQKAFEATAVGLSLASKG